MKDKAVTSFRTLLAEADIRRLEPADLIAPGIPADGRNLLRDAAIHFAQFNAARLNRHKFIEDVELSSSTDASSSWFADRKIAALVWEGDLHVDGDLIDDDFSMPPLLVVRGSLTVRSWLRGGMPTFVAGNVRASGFIVGHYNDSPLFVGGDLSATGYIPRAKPYHDRPDVVPHQITGRIDARRFDALAASSQGLRENFVEEVLVEDEEGTYLDEKEILQRLRNNQNVWR